MINEDLIQIFSFFGYGIPIGMLIGCFMFLLGYTFDFIISLFRK